MSAAAWRIFASAKGTRLLMLATTGTRLIFRRMEQTSPQPMFHAQTKNFMQGTRILHTAQVLLATLVEKKDTMPNSVQSQETRPLSRTTVAIIQHPSETISTPTTKPNNGGNNSAPKRNNFNPNNNHRKGHLNHVTKEEAQNAPDIILDTFPVNTIPATVLFDSGASHSFISKKFALQHDFSMLPLGKSMIIKSPGIKQITQSYCQGVVIEFEGPATVLFDSGASHSFISKKFALQHDFSMLPLGKSMIIKSPGIKQITQSYCQGVVIEFEGL